MKSVSWPTGLTLFTLHLRANENAKAIDKENNLRQTESFRKVKITPVFVKIITCFLTSQDTTK